MPQPFQNLYALGQQGIFHTFPLHDVSGKGEHELNLTGPLLLLLSELCHAIMLTFQDPDMIFRISSSLFTPFNFNVVDLGIILYHIIPSQPDFFPSIASQNPQHPRHQDFDSPQVPQEIAVRNYWPNPIALLSWAASLGVFLTACSM